MLPELKSTCGFLRARSVEVFGEFSNFDFKNKENVRLAAKGIYKCMSDIELPVRVKAAI